MALKAETYHTLADVVSSLMVFAGLQIARRKTKQFPYGLYKVENLFSVIIAL
jgi:divalent metal cation (Fe/Co/Zn/Cd) transporter